MEWRTTSSHEWPSVLQGAMWGFPKSWVYSLKLVELNMENPLKMDDLGYPILGNFHVLKPWTTVPQVLKSHTAGSTWQHIFWPWRIPGLEDKIRFLDERNGYSRFSYSQVWMNVLEGAYLAFDDRNPFKPGSKISQTRCQGNSARRN